MEFTPWSFVANFLNFLIEKKGEDAADLEKWSLEELKEAVEQFKSKNIQSSDKNDNNNHLNINNLTPFEEIITCIKQEKSPLSDCSNLKLILSE